MSIHGLPLILFQGGVGDTDMGDIQFLSVKEFDGKLRSNEGNLSTTGDLATLTANTGKDMYLASAKVNWYTNNPSSSIQNSEVVLKINGTIIERCQMACDGSADSPFAYEFKNIGHSVAASQVIKLEVISIDADVDIEGFVECFEEDTGNTPQIPSI